MAELLNLVAATRALAGPGGPALEVVRLDANDTTIIPFTADVIHLYVHYCEDPEIGGPGYVPCNQEAEGRCLACEVGRTRDERYLLPVYVPKEKAVGVLPVSPSRRPNALLPQLLTHLERKEPVVLFLRREGGKFAVGSAPLPPGCDDGAAAVAEFRERLGRREVRLEDAFPRVPNARLAQAAEVVRGLAFRGKTP